jgi:TolA-binding protein
MKWQMKLFRAWKLALLLSSGLAQAASNAEKREWDAACKSFQDAKSPIFWAQAQDRFARFVKIYPNSEHFAEGLVFEARAMYEQGKYAEAIDFFSAQAAQADGMADQFAYWTAKAYSQEKNYEAAAETYGRLIRENPTSPLKTEAVFREAEAHSRLGEWPRVIEELGEPNGIFQQLAKTNRNDDLVVSGMLLLAEAQLSQKDYPAAEKTWGNIASVNLRPELEWDRQALLCRIQLADGQPEAALRNSTNLLASADEAKPGLKTELKARSIILRGEILERLHEWPAAIQTYETNLTSDLPRDRQREALLRIVELTLRQNKIAEAADRLSDFLARNPGEKTTDFELLMLGELQLKQFYAPDGTNAAAAGTNLLQSAETNFAGIIQNFTNSAYVGKAELNLGWCYLAENKFSESLAAFSNAVLRLPFSEDQAVARFKVADILFDQKDFGGALSNYTALVGKYSSLPDVKNELFEPALYQMVRAALEETNLPAANSAMNQILAWFPGGALGDRSMLLVGQAESPKAARAVFMDFLQRSPKSPLLPEVKLAIARTYENEPDWANALAQYDAWVKIYTNSSALPRAEFSRAWANYQAGNETNALLLFTDFVTKFRTNAAALSNDLPARAQYWVAEFYWRQEDFQKAELNYKEVFNDWPNSRLAFQARMMAGMAAFARSPQDAKIYFTDLTRDSNCPPGLVAQAAFALGDANLELPLAGNPTKFKDAIEWFRYITTTFTNSPISAQAWGRIGDCYFALGSEDPAQYEVASNAYVRVMESGVADAATRSLAEIRLGKTLENISLKKAPDEQKVLRNMALTHFTNVIYGNNLRDHEQSDPVSVKDAGLEAAKLAEDLGQWAQARQIYQRLLKSMPPLQSYLEKKIAKADENLLQEKK